MPRLSVIFIAVAICVLASAFLVNETLAPLRRSQDVGTDFGKQGREARNQFENGRDVTRRKRSKDEKLKIVDADTLMMSDNQRLISEFLKASEVIAANGNYSYLHQLINDIPLEKRAILFVHLPRIFSKLGPVHDIKQKFLLAEKLSNNQNDLKNLREAILGAEAVYRIGDMREEGVLKSLNDADFSIVCRSLGLKSLSEGFALASEGSNESSVRLAASTIAGAAMASGPLAASSTISKLPKGLVRDEAIAEMVVWLKNSGSAAEAKPWIDAISDPKARKRAIRD